MKIFTLICQHNEHNPGSIIAAATKRNPAVTGVSEDIDYYKGKAASSKDEIYWLAPLVVAGNRQIIGKIHESYRH